MEEAQNNYLYKSAILSFVLWKKNLKFQVFIFAEWVSVLKNRNVIASFRLFMDKDNSSGATNTRYLALIH